MHEGGVVAVVVLVAGAHSGDDILGALNSDVVQAFHTVHEEVGHIGIRIDQVDEIHGLVGALAVGGDAEHELAGAGSGDDGIAGPDDVYLKVGVDPGSHLVGGVAGGGAEQLLVGKKLLNGGGVGQHVGGGVALVIPILVLLPEIPVLLGIENVDDGGAVGRIQDTAESAVGAEVVAARYNLLVEH